MGKSEKEDYELLSHSEVERLRKQASKGGSEEKTLGDVDESLKETTRSIRDLKNLLGSIKRQILDDYASNPNPEELLDKIIKQNTQIAKSFVNLMKRVKKVEKQQEEIIDKLNKQELENNKKKQSVPSMNPQLNNQMGSQGMESSMSGSNSQMESPQGSMSSADNNMNRSNKQRSQQGMPSPNNSDSSSGSSPDFESLAPPPEDETEEKGFFKKLVGQ